MGGVDRLSRKAKGTQSSPRQGAPVARPGPFVFVAYTSWVMGDSPPMDSYCTVSECEHPPREGRARCEMHEKRYQRGQCLTAPKAERLPPHARLVEVAIRLADAETDEEFEKAKRDLLRTAKQTGPALHGELVRQGMATARKRGVKVGPPFTVDPLQVREAVTREGSITAAASALSVSRPTVYRALARVTQSPIALRQAA